MNIKSLLKVEISESLKKIVSGIEVDAEKIAIEYPENLDHGDFSTNAAMINFKNSGLKSPRDFANALVESLNSNQTLSPYIKKIEVAGPGFINFHLKNSYFGEILKTINSNIDEFAKPKQVNVKASIEHTDMNPNKELHVGHLRNSCIGDAVVNLLKYSGRDLTVQYYQNDAGLQISSIVLAYKEKFVDMTKFEKLHKWAAVAYVDIEKRLETDQQLSAKREEIQKNISMQNNDDARLAKTITDEIMRNVLDTMSGLDIKFDLIVCESEVIKNKIWEEAFELLKTNKAFYKAEAGEKMGCWLVKMANSDDKVFVRSNGIPNYVAIDFAFEMWKFGLLKDFKYGDFVVDSYKNPISITDSEGNPKKGYNEAKEVYLIVDTTQSYPQQSIIEALRALGYEQQADNYHHVAYGFVYLSKNTAQKLGIEVETSETKPIKMSGRKGTVVSVDDFVSKVESALKERFGDFKNLKEVRDGSIKFEMLKNNTYQDMVFDIDTSTDNKGFTGPYIQYTYARAMSVLKKSKASTTNINLENVNEIEMKVLKELNRLPEEIERATLELSPHYICHYMYELAQAFNTFYNSEQILGSENESFRIELTSGVASALKHSMSLLGIKSPAEM